MKASIPFQVNPYGSGEDFYERIFVSPFQIITLPHPSPLLNNETVLANEHILRTSVHTWGLS